MNAILSFIKRLWIKIKNLFVKPKLKQVSTFDKSITIEYMDDSSIEVLHVEQVDYNEIEIVFNSECELYETKSEELEVTKRASGVYRLKWKQ